MPLAACLLLAGVGVGCGPKIDRGVVPAEQARQAIPIETLEQGSWEVELVGGGSRWDPIGQPGAGQAALELANGGRFQLTVDRDTAILRGRACTDPETCVAGLSQVLGGARLLQTPPERLHMHLEDVARNNPCSASALALQDCARDVWFSLAYEGHPYGNPTWGRTGTLPSLTRADLGRALASRVTRGTVRARATPELTRAMAAELEGVPPGLPPDPAMKGPPTPRGPTLAVGTIPGEAALVAIGTALPRTAAEATGARPDPERSARALAAQTCLIQALGARADADASRIAPLTPTPLTHPAVGAMVGPTTPDRALATVEALGDTLRGLSDACPALADVPEGTLDADRITVVVLWPESAEDPWADDVQAGIGTILRLDDEDWLR